MRYISSITESLPKAQKGFGMQKVRFRVVSSEDSISSERVMRSLHPGGGKGSSRTKRMERGKNATSTGIKRKLLSSKGQSS